MDVVLDTDASIVGHGTNGFNPTCYASTIRAEALSYSGGFSDSFPGSSLGTSLCRKLLLPVVWPGSRVGWVARSEPQQSE
ncbi:MAG TPA: hypothetical protein VJ440_00740 [Candidatus Brocadiaceae bacterium]|nr:hypothetical protein [Candidatus Brocadiaceae bacterium]